MPDPVVLFGPEYLSIPRPESAWLIRSLVPRDGFVLMHAPPKQGKTTAILQCAEALSDPAQPTFFGLGIHEHGPVGFLQLDTPADLWRDEYVQLMNDAGLSFARVAFHDRLSMPKECFPFNILNALHAHWLGAWVKAFNPVAVIVDSFRACFVGSEDKAELTMPVLNALKTAISPAALILIHHNKKPGADYTPTDESRVEEVRGSTALTGAADTIWRVGRKRWAITGRGGDAKIEVVFDHETHLLTPKTIITPDLIAALLSDPQYTSQRKAAGRLSDLSGLPFETCRNYLKRFKT